MRDVGEEVRVRVIAEEVVKGIGVVGEVYKRRTDEEDEKGARKAAVWR